MTSPWFWVLVGPVSLLGAAPWMLLARRDARRDLSHKQPPTSTPEHFAECEPLCVRGEHTADCLRHRQPLPSAPSGEQAD